MKSGQWEKEYFDHLGNALLNEMDYIHCLEERLAFDGVEFGDAYKGLPYTGRAVLLLEVVNLAAKCFDYGYYEDKVALARILIDLNVFSFTEGDDWFGNVTYHFYHPSVGTVCIHDPNDELSGIQPSHAHPGLGWSHVYRQNLAFAACQDSELLQVLAIATRPRIGDVVPRQICEMRERLNA
jgi:hypothetical protein